MAEVVVSDSANAAAFEALAATPLLAGVKDEGLQLLAREGALRVFAVGDWVVREGESGHSMFILMSGEVEVIKHFGEPQEVTLARLRDRTFFGEMCVVDPVPRAASVRALTEVSAIEISSGTLHRLFRQMPSEYSIFVLNLARDLARRLRKLDEAFAAKA